MTAAAAADRDSGYGPIMEPITATPYNLAQSLPGLTVEEIVTSGNLTLTGPGHGLHLCFWTDEQDHQVITLSGLDQHLRQVIDPIDHLLVCELSRLLDNDTLLEVFVADEEVLDHVLYTYPDRWRFVADGHEPGHPFSGDTVPALANYFDHDSYEARLLRCYRDSAQLWADGASRNVLAELTKHTGLYLADEIDRVVNPQQGFPVPDGFHDQKFRWLSFS